MFVELPREVRDVMVSNPKKLDAVLQTSTRAYVIGNDAGEANVFFNDKDGNQILTLEVTVERDLSGLSDLLNRLLPNSKIHVEAVSGSVVLTGTVTSPLDATRAGEIANSVISVDASAPPTTSTSSNTGVGAIGVGTSSQSTSSPTAAGQVINMITVEGREQVLLKVSVVEMERNIVKQFGIDLNALVSSGSFAFAALSDLPFPINAAGKGSLRPSFRVPRRQAGCPNLAAPVVSNTSGFGAQWTNGPSRVQSVLRALEEDGLLHTLAEPNLTAISGETANFLAGGEFPVPVAQQLGTISVEFKKFGIGLAFTPVVMSEGRISLKVSTEVSELTNQGAVKTGHLHPGAEGAPRRDDGRAAERRLDGDGGLAVRSVEAGAERLSGPQEPADPRHAVPEPRLSEKDETELVVIVTPYVVKPVARQQLAQPDQGFGWASDVDADLMGQMNRVYGRNPERAPVGKFDGDVGFIVDQ